ncbi:fructosamine kinase family protein [Catenuloplanes japonicus]|uniref:fructosamine kinase family protein n=1 Tax=Catenuloplanes japonicus TaxID=33876 RepID=UPI00068D7FB6|nr:fructosamine kinase family protein [Catenuloplanes japonicus]
MGHPLRQPPVVREIERAASSHLGRPWRVAGFTGLDDRASHPCGLLHGVSLSVFAKIGSEEQFAAELAGLRLVRDLTAVATPPPIGVIRTEAGAVLLLEAVAEVPPHARTSAHWRALGHSLALAHRTHAPHFGLAGHDGFFGPLRQDNRPVSTDRWADFYAERRLLPHLREAVDSGNLPPALHRHVERLITRLPSLCGPEPRPSLLHGDAQQNNLLTTAHGAVWVDVAPYFGHPEVDLALLDYFAPVPDEVFHAYAEVTPIDAGFARRKELWRLFGYLAVVTVDGASAFGRPFLDRIAGVDG